ncbi:hypothetical protein Q5H92_14635 [Hymenobacter sp. M29]|uniref:Uncharacterized protein n=1 Tax=Hymenobacter mellowenesis TaxID=3063995 RepID=A0ABT9ACL9_9BACT|nr:hypothetical protein [Hymenobacter sp. M29]MDO7847602.1 hypothetical protein [Hymenobacter sp. M29]
MKDKHTANLLQEELKLVCKRVSEEYQKVYGYEWDFGVDEVQHNQKLVAGGKKPSDVLTLSVMTTYPDLPGAHYRDDKVLNGEPVKLGYKKLWQQTIEVLPTKGLTEARVFAYRQLLFFLTMGFITGVINMEPEELEAISTNPS